MDPWKNRTAIMHDKLFYLPYSEQDKTFIRQQVYIACRAYFPECLILTDTVICYRDMQQFAIVEIDFRYPGAPVTFDIFGFDFPNMYDLDYDILLERLKLLSTLT